MRNFQPEYAECLKAFPSPGQGCHAHILRSANYGRLASITPEQIFQDIRLSIPAGKRRVGDKEIIEAIHKSLSDVDFRVKPAPVINDGKAKLADIISKSKICDEADLWEDSPVRIDWLPEEDPIRFLKAMFKPEDFVFIGERESPGVVGKTIRIRDEWIDYFNRGGKTSPFIIINPLNGRPAQKKTGDGETYRSDENVSDFQNCLVEYDTLTRTEQIRFWASPIVKTLGVALIVDTAGKSLHGWIKTPNIKTLDDWRRDIRGKLYDQALIPLGVDGACSNPARLSRFPGHLRDSKYQRILWLNAEVEI